jgi:hypothetical protein
MATRHGIQEALANLGAAYSSLRKGADDPRTIDVWFSVLQNCSDSDVASAVHRWLMEEEGPPPKPAQIRLMASKRSTVSDASRLPAGCDACSETGRRIVAVLRREPLGKPADQQRRELREFAATCDCPRGQHYAISPSWVNWNTLADLAWKHADTVLDATGRPCVQLDPRPELISRWSKECQR